MKRLRMGWVCRGGGKVATTVGSGFGEENKSQIKILVVPLCLYTFWGLVARYESRVDQKRREKKCMVIYNRKADDRNVKQRASTFFFFSFPTFYHHSYPPHVYVHHTHPRPPARRQEVGTEQIAAGRTPKRSTTAPYVPYGHVCQSERLDKRSIYR